MIKKGEGEETDPISLVIEWESSFSIYGGYRENADVSICRFAMCGYAQVGQWKEIHSLGVKF